MKWADKRRMNGNSGWSLLFMKRFVRDRWRLHLPSEEREHFKLRSSLCASANYWTSWPDHEVIRFMSLISWTGDFVGHSETLSIEQNHEMWPFHFFLSFKVSHGPQSTFFRRNDIVWWLLRCWHTSGHRIKIWHLFFLVACVYDTRNCVLDSLNI